MNVNKYEKIKKTLSEIKSQIMKFETPTTYEAVGVHFKLKNADISMFKCLGLDLAQAYSIVDNAKNGNSKAIIGPYKIEHYVDIFKQLENLSEMITEDNIWSRQFIIQLPAIHCFQSIQFIMRNDALHIVVNMRSCNFKVNLITDIFISYYCGETLAQLMEEKFNGYTFDKIHVIMNIGSLHIFKSEV